MHFNDKLRLIQIDSGADVSILPVSLLTSEQRKGLKFSNLVIQAYGGVEIKNLGEFEGDLSFIGIDGNRVAMKNCKFLVTDKSVTPLLGCDMIFKGNESRHILDKKEGLASRNFSLPNLKSPKCVFLLNNN